MQSFFAPSSLAHIEFDALAAMYENDKDTRRRAMRKARHANRDS
jgi:hypothetical protein